MNIQKDLHELIKAELITQETAEKITLYYENKKNHSANRVFIVFGILGALLVGLGIILILAHNWDELSRPVKTFFAFLPLVTGQSFGLFVILNKKENTAWIEGSGTFLFFAVAASISLVSQIYNIEGTMSGFLLSWMLLCLPLVYVLRSSLVSLLYITGITAYALYAGENYSFEYGKYLYWILLAAVIPYYYDLLMKKPQSNFTVFHNWIIGISLLFGLGVIAGHTEELMFVAYFSLFGVFYQLGSFELFEKQKLRNNAYKIIGSLGTVVLSVTLSFEWFWEELSRKNLSMNEIVGSVEFFAVLVLSTAGIILLYQRYKNKSLKKINPVDIMFLLFIITYYIGIHSSFAMVLMNIYVLAIGIMNIREGAKQNHLGILNYGLLTLTVLIVGRFFVTDISFVIRGVVFIIIGLGFFAANYWMIKKRKLK